MDTDRQRKFDVGRSRRPGNKGDERAKIAARQSQYFSQCLPNTPCLDHTKMNRRDKRGQPVALDSGLQNECSRFGNRPLCGGDAKIALE